LTPVDAYVIYSALMLHFTTDSYDAVKYHMKTKASPDSFWKRKDKFFFTKIARRHPREGDLKNFMIANFLDGNTWIGDMDDDAFTEWTKTNQSLTQTFRNDMSFMSEEHEKFNPMLCPDGPNLSPLINMLLAGDISLETVVIIDRLTNFIDKTEHLVTDTILWPDLRRKIKKYAILMPPIDKEKYITLLKNSFTS